jgi:predicted AlkP superfamily pyrophosphatase or phosphodiesterase
MDFDHTAHHNNDRESHLATLQQIDAQLGRLWTGIQNSPMASETAFIIVSDHGFNTDERIISQGFNLVKLLGSRAGRRTPRNYQTASADGLLDQIDQSFCAADYHYRDRLVLP